MRNKITVLLAALLMLGSFSARAQMTDDAVLDYVVQAASSGKSKTQVAAELSARGVSSTQAKRVFETYKQNSDAAATEDAATQKSPAKPRTPAKDELEAPNAAVDSSRADRIVYGHDMFAGSRPVFEPNENAATPDNYVLGPGDEVNITLWGQSELDVTCTISPEGNIKISRVGSVALSGLTVKEARGKLKSVLGKYYAGVSGGATSMSVTLANIRTIKINVLGEVRTPGTYRLSSFSSVFNALYAAGGVTPDGSLRAIKLVRGGETFAIVDVYPFIFNGSFNDNVNLQDGDVLIVPTYTGLAYIGGGIRRPMHYEVTPTETVSDLIAYAGGFTDDAYRDEVAVSRREGVRKSIYNVVSDNFSTFRLADGDSLAVNVNAVLEYTNRVDVRGAVYRPGSYQLGGDIATVRQLVEHAGGLLDHAFAGRAQIVREKADKSLEIVAVPLKGIMDGTLPDMALQNHDILSIADAAELDRKGDYTITGYVVNPGDYPFAENTTVEDLILLAGGLLEGASAARVEVSRRIIDPASTAKTETLSEVYSFSLGEGLVIDGSGGFTLQPYDVVAVRKSPTYEAQKTVLVSGEVNFPGEYVLVSNTERLSDIIARAGGVTPSGNLKGGMLVRKTNSYEANMRNNIADILRTDDKVDTTDVRMILEDDEFNVGVEMENAVARPGSDYDIVLRDGDEIIIPQMSSTVHIQGEVLYPNAVQYVSGKTVRYYVKQAGGFTTRARRRGVYVVHMNGTVSTGMCAAVEPGCEIIVPRKEERQKMTVSEWLSIGTTSASLTTMVITIINLIK